MLTADPHSSGSWRLRTRAARNLEASKESHSATVYLLDVGMSTGDVLRPLLESVHIPLETFGDPTEFLEVCDRECVQGCLLLSVRLPGMSGFDALGLLKERSIELPTIFLGYGGDVPSAVRAMKLGAVDYFENPPPYQLLIERIQAILRREEARLCRQREIDSIRARMEALTRRETEVLERVVHGTINKQIARMLKISPKTVEMHRSRLMMKMGARTAADLVRKWCTAQGNGGPGSKPAYGPETEKCEPEWQRVNGNGRSGRA